MRIQILTKYSSFDGNKNIIEISQIYRVFKRGLNHLDSTIIYEISLLYLSMITDVQFVIRRVDLLAVIWHWLDHFKKYTAHSKKNYLGR